MTQSILPLMHRLFGSEDGNATIEFAIIFPAFMFFILAGAELTLLTTQQGMLERAVDQTVRDIRLGTGNNPQHDELKDTICSRAQFIKNCSSNLRLEMIRQSAFTGVVLSDTPDCTDNSEQVDPVLNFTNGQSNELMILRACARIDPVFPTSTIGKTLVDETGQYALTATTAFVQEPL